MWRSESQTFVEYTTTPCESGGRPLAKWPWLDSTWGVIRPGFLDKDSRQDLIELARDGSAVHRLARRANALVLLDDGMSCAAIVKVLLLANDAIRSWYRLYEEGGIEGLPSFGQEGSVCRNPCYQARATLLTRLSNR